MNGKDIIDALNKGADFIEAITPIATAIGGSNVGAALDLANMVIDIAQNIEERVNDGSVVMNSDDEAAIKAIIARVATQNDALHAAILRS